MAKCSILIKVLFKDNFGSLVTGDNYRMALRWVDHFITSAKEASFEAKLKRFGKELKVKGLKELKTMLREKGNSGIQILSEEWVSDCLDKGRQIDTKKYELYKEDNK